MKTGDPSVLEAFIEVRQRCLTWLPACAHEGSDSYTHRVIPLCVPVLSEFTNSRF